MKIKTSLVRQIIKEEAVKVKRLIELKEEKQAILKQLNELYQEVDLDEAESILSLIPDQNDQQLAQQDMQQAQTTQQAPGTLEEEMLDEGIGGILGKIQNLLFGTIKQKDPQGFEQAANAIGQQYAGKSFQQIYNDIKGVAQPALEEAMGGKKTMTKDEAKASVEKIAAKVGTVAGVSAPLTYFASAIWTAIQGTGFGIPSVLGAVSGGLLATAIVAGLIYLLASYYRNKQKNVQ